MLIYYKVPLFLEFSLSLYFLILFGVSKLHGLLLSGDDDEEIIVVDDI